MVCSMLVQHVVLVSLCLDVCTGILPLFCCIHCTTWAGIVDHGAALVPQVDNADGWASVPFV